LTVARNRAGYVVKTTVTNTGDRAGDEVAQLYLRFPKVDGVPNIALRGFQRTTLKPGETRQISFRLAPRDLSSVNLAGDHLIHAGRYEIHVGGQQPGADTETRSAPLVIAHSQALPH
jgi:beta-glucosidase